jgi:hypothetical protein
LCGAVDVAQGDAYGSHIGCLGGTQLMLQLHERVGNRLKSKDLTARAYYSRHKAGVKSYISSNIPNGHSLTDATKDSTNRWPLVPRHGHCAKILTSLSNLVAFVAMGEFN